MLCTNENARSCSFLQFLELPTELVSLILEYLSLEDLNQVCLTCKQLREISSHLGIWRQRAQQYINFCTLNSDVIDKKSLHVPVKERCRIAHNWSSGNHREYLYLKFKTGLLPWLQLTRDHLYISVMNQVARHQLKSNGRPLWRAVNEVKYTGHCQDIIKFVVKENDIISCGRDGRLLVWDKSSGKPLGAMSSDLSTVMSVDTTREIVVGGMNNKGVQLWSRADNRPVRHIPMTDRVWTVRVDPTHRVFAAGSSGNTDLRSLKLWDIETARFPQVCGENKKKGAGILDLKFESSHLLLSAGYDTYIRMWDIRRPRVPVLEFEEPDDNVVYCIASDNMHFIASGSCRHGLVRFWDKRKTNSCIQKCYVGGSQMRSPVYSLQFNENCLYAALSHGIYILDFNHVCSLNSTHPR